MHKLSYLCNAATLGQTKDKKSESTETVITGIIWETLPNIKTSKRQWRRNKINLDATSLPLSFQRSLTHQLQCPKHGAPTWTHHPCPTHPSRPSPIKCSRKPPQKASIRPSIQRSKTCRRNTTSWTTLLRCLRTIASSKKTRSLTESFMMKGKRKHSLKMRVAKQRIWSQLKKFRVITWP